MTEQPKDITSPGRPNGTYEYGAPPPVGAPPLVFPIPDPEVHAEMEVIRANAKAGGATEGGDDE